MQSPNHHRKAYTLEGNLITEAEEKETLSSSGITISEYLINNYPPALQTAYEDPIEDSSASMVPLRNSAYSTSSDMMMEDTSDYPSRDDDYQHLPYNQIEAEEMKKARRRMKNKISAQESRRRKKEYVDSLEARLKQRDQEKNLLKEKVTELEDKIRMLVDELFSAKQNQHKEKHSAMNDEDDASTKFKPKCISQISRATQTGICLLCFLNRNKNAPEYYNEHEIEIEHRDKSNSDESSSAFQSTNDSMSIQSTLSDCDVNVEDDEVIMKNVDVSYREKQFGTRPASDDEGMSYTRERPTVDTPRSLQDEGCQTMVYNNSPNVKYRQLESSFYERQLCSSSKSPQGEVFYDNVGHFVRRPGSAIIR